MPRPFDVLSSCENSVKLVQNSDIGSDLDVKHNPVKRGLREGKPQVGRTHSVIAFKAWSGPEHGQVDIYKTCDKRVTAVITYYAK